MGKQQDGEDLWGVVHTPYGTYRNGEWYVSADGSGFKVQIIDVDSFREVEDLVIQYPGGPVYRMDWFKFSYRYKKDEQ